MKYKIITLLFLSFSILSHSQRIKIEKGSLKELKGIVDYNLTFDYSEIEVINFKSEADFIKIKVDKRELAEKGSGSIFKEKWFSNRTQLYEPSFEKHFNSYFIMKRKIIVSRNTHKSKYTILIKTTSIYPGYNVVIDSQAAKLRATITVFETNKPENIILKTKLIKVHRSHAAYNMGTRIANGYGVLGMRLAQLLRKKT